MNTERGELREKVFLIKDLVAYQKGAIASRMVVFKKSGTITVFSVDEGEGFPEHTAPYDAVLTITDGIADVEIAGANYSVREGETIILPSNKPHAVFAKKERFKMVLTMIREQDAPR